MYRTAAAEMQTDFLLQHNY